MFISCVNMIKDWVAGCCLENGFVAQGLFFENYQQPYFAMVKLSKLAMLEDSKNAKICGLLGKSWPAAMNTGIEGQTSIRWKSIVSIWHDIE